MDYLILSSIFIAASLCVMKRDGMLIMFGIVWFIMYWVDKIS